MLLLADARVQRCSKMSGEPFVISTLDLDDDFYAFLPRAQDAGTQDAATQDAATQDAGSPRCSRCSDVKPSFPATVS